MPAPDTHTATGSYKLPPPEHVTLVTPNGRRDTSQARALTQTLAAAGITTHRATYRELARNRRAQAQTRRSLLVTREPDPQAAVVLAARLDAPILHLVDDDGIHALTTRQQLRVTFETVLTVRLDQRPPREAVAECILRPATNTTTLAVEIDNGRIAFTTIALHFATTDPLRILPAGSCRHDGDPTMVGVCIDANQALADRVVHASSKTTIVPTNARAQIRVECDNHSFQGLASHVQIGPNRHYRWVHLPADQTAHT